MQNLYFNRRFLTLCAVLPLAAAAPFLGLWALAVGVVALTIAAVMMTIWPAATLDTLGLSFAGALILLVGLPLGGWLASHVVGDVAVFLVIFWAVMAVALFFLWLGSVRLLAASEGIPAGQRRIRHRALLPMSVEEALPLFILRPEMELMGRKAGPANAEGFFPVTFSVEAPNSEDFTDEMREHTSLERIVEEEAMAGGGYRVVTQSLIRIHDEEKSGIAELTFIPDSGGTRFVQDEVCEYFSLLSLAMYWLQDASSSWIAARIHAHETGDLTTAEFTHQRTPMTEMARFFVALQARQADDGPRQS